MHTKNSKERVPRTPTDRIRPSSNATFRTDKLQLMIYYRDGLSHWTGKGERAPMILRDGSVELQSFEPLTYYVCMLADNNSSFIYNNLD